MLALRYNAKLCNMRVLEEPVLEEVCRCMIESFEWPRGCMGAALARLPGELRTALMHVGVTEYCAPIRHSPFLPIAAGDAL